MPFAYSSEFREMVLDQIRAGRPVAEDGAGVPGQEILLRSRLGLMQEDPDVQASEETP